MEEILKAIKPAEVLEYRFTIQYRLRRGNEYLSVQEERLLLLNEQGQLTKCILFRDTSAERIYSRVQLDWYRVNPLGLQRIGTYVPVAAEQELTAREVEVVQLIRQGFSSKEIAHRLNITTNTVRNHRSSLFRKTQARNMVDLVNNTPQSYAVVSA